MRAASRAVWRGILCAAVLGVWALAGAGTAAAQVLRDPVTTMVTNDPTASAPFLVLKGDFDGDQQGDLLITTIFEDVVSIPTFPFFRVDVFFKAHFTLGNANGSFKDPVTFDLPTSSTTNALTDLFKTTLGDFNGDGATDVAWVRSGQVLIQLSQISDAGVWSLSNLIPVPLPEGFPIVSIRLRTADYNSDGKTDFLIENDVPNNPAGVQSGAPAGFRRDKNIMFLINTSGQNTDQNQRGSANDSRPSSDAVDTSGSQAGPPAVVTFEQYFFRLQKFDRDEVGGNAFVEYSNFNNALYQDFFADLDFNGDNRPDLFTRRNASYWLGGRSQLMVSNLGSALQGDRAIQFQTNDGDTNGDNSQLKFLDENGGNGADGNNGDAFKPDLGVDFMPCDLDGDGTTDLVRREVQGYASDRSDSVRVFVNKGDGRKFSQFLLRNGAIDANGLLDDNANEPLAEPFRCPSNPATTSSITPGPCVSVLEYPNATALVGSQASLLEKAASNLFLAGTTTKGMYAAALFGDGRDALVALDSVRSSGSSPTWSTFFYVVRFIGAGRLENVFYLPIESGVAAPFYTQMAAVTLDVNGDEREDMVLVFKERASGGLRIRTYLAGEWFDSRIAGTSSVPPQLVRVEDKTLLFRRDPTERTFRYAVLDSSENWQTVGSNAADPLWEDVPFSQAEKDLYKAEPDAQIQVVNDGALVNVFVRLLTKDPTRLHLTRFILANTASGVSKLNQNRTFSLAPPDPTTGSRGRIRESIEPSITTADWYSRPLFFQGNGDLPGPDHFQVVLGEGETASHWNFIYTSQDKKALFIRSIRRDEEGLFDTSAETVPGAMSGTTTFAITFPGIYTSVLRTSVFGGTVIERPSACVYARQDYTRDENGAVLTVQRDGSVGTLRSQIGPRIAIAFIQDGNHVVLHVPIDDRGVPSSLLNGAFASPPTPYGVHLQPFARALDTGGTRPTYIAPFVYPASDGFLHFLSVRPSGGTIIERGHRTLEGDVSSGFADLTGDPPAAASYLVAETDADARSFRVNGPWETPTSKAFNPKEAIPSTTPGVSGLSVVEYPRISGSSTNLRGSMRRAIALTDAGGHVRVIRGGKVQDLRMKYLGRSVADAKIVGYFEGPPPVPPALAEAGARSSVVFAASDTQKQIASFKAGAQAGIGGEIGIASFKSEFEFLFGGFQETEDTSEVTITTEYSLKQLYDEVAHRTRQIGLAYLRGKEVRLFQLLEPLSGAPVALSLVPTGRDAVKIVPFGLRKDFLDLNRWDSVSQARDDEAIAWEDSIAKQVAKLQNRLALAKDPDIVESIVNKYQWNAYGGFLAVSTQAAKSHAEYGSFNFNGSLGLGVAWDVSAGLAIQTKLTEGEVLFKIQAEVEDKSGQESTQGFQMTVNLDDMGDLTLVKGTSGGRGNPEALLLDAYDLSMFYMGAGTEHFDAFFNDVVNPNWLAPVHVNDTPLIRLAKTTFRNEFGATNRKPVWRIAPRVTFISTTYGSLPPNYRRLVE